MKIKMTLLSDAIFGNGISVPGKEDISVQCDSYGFPYYRGGTFKGIFREELFRYYNFIGNNEPEAESETSRLLGAAGSNENTQSLVFSNFTLSSFVKSEVLKEIGADSPTVVRDVLTNMRTFTAIDENGMVREASLRMARCINKGLVFYSSIDGISKEDQQTVNNVLGMIKWIGTMRNRGFGKVRIEEA